MNLSRPAVKFIIFQSVNLLVSVLILAGVHQIYAVHSIFSLKIIALIYLNDVPAKTDPFSLAFFALACIDVLLMLWLGSFSIYTFLFRL